MKVLLLAQFLPPILGGEERHVWTLARALAARAHEVTLLGFATGGDEPAESHSEGVRIVRVRTAASHLPILYSDSTRPHALPLPDPLVSRAIRRELSHGRFDVIHAHNWIVNSALGPAARAQVPVVMTLHTYSHICATMRLMEHGKQRCPGPSPARCLSCATAHHGAVRGAVTLAANTWSAWRRSDRVSRVAAVSSAVADAVALHDNSWLNFARLNAEVIPNFIPDDIVLDEIPPTAPQAPLLFVGDLSPDKGVQTLLDAYRLLDGPPPLVLAGRLCPGSEWTMPDGVRWLGALPHDEVLALFRSARAVIVPSIVGDACPTVVSRWPRVDPSSPAPPEASSTWSSTGSPGSWSRLGMCQRWRRPFRRYYAIRRARRRSAPRDATGHGNSPSAPLFHASSACTPAPSRKPRSR